MSKTEALRAALAQALAALATCNSNEGDDPWFDHEKVYAAREAARAALAQPAASGKPVAYLVRDVGGERGTGMLVRARNIGSYQRATLEREPLYTAQPAPARVPLTDEQISNMWAHECVRERLTSDLVQAFARAIEAAHGITAPGAPDAGPVQ